MSASIFMRGDPLDLTSTFYLAYTSSNSTYLYCLNSSNYQYGSNTPVAGFLTMTSDYSNYSAVQFLITSLGNNQYVFQSGSKYLGLNSSNIIDLVSSTQTAITFKAPTNYEQYNVYDIPNVIYPGLPYTLLINESSYKWYIFNSSSPTSWNTYTIFMDTTTPFIFPVNTGQLAVWQVTDSYQNGSCFYSSTDPNIGIEWLYNWMSGTSVNCDTQGKLDNTYNNCYFSDLLACEAMYAYNLCNGTNTCGDCMGNVKTSGLQCRYNIPGSDPVLFQSSIPVTTSINNAIELNDTLTSTSDSSSSTSIAVFVVILFIIMIIGVIIWLVGKNNKKENKTSKKTNDSYRSANQGYSILNDIMISMQY